MPPHEEARGSVKSWNRLSKALRYGRRVVLLVFISMLLNANYPSE